MGLQCVEFPSLISKEEMGRPVHRGSTSFQSQSFAGNTNENTNEIQIEKYRLRNTIENTN